MLEILNQECLKNGYTLPETLVSDDENIEEKDHQRWEDLRKTGVGGSEAGIIYLGQGTYQSVFDIQLRKITDVEEEVDYKKQFIFDTGHMMEPAIANYFAGKHNAKVIRDKGSYKRGVANANCDAYAIMPNGEIVGLEFKTVSPYKRADWQSGVYGKDGIIGVPEYFYQCQHYMYVNGFNKFIIVAYFKDGNPDNIVEVVVDRDDEIIESLIKREEEFWENRFDLKLPETITKYQKEPLMKKMIDLGIEVEGLDEKVKEYYELKETERALKKRAETIGERLLKLRNDIEVHMIQNGLEYAKIGGFDVKRTVTKGYTYIKSKLDQIPELEMFRKPSETVRFSIKESKK